MSVVKVLAVVVGAVLVMATTACSSPTVMPHPTATVVDQGFGGIMPPQTDPLLAYAQDPDVIIALQRAEDILTDRCVRTFGFDGFQATNYAALAASFQVGGSRLYGITDAKVAAKYGYLPAPSEDATTPAEQSDDSYRFVLLGLKPGQNPGQVSHTTSPGNVGKLTIPPGGCLGQSRQQLTGEISGRPADQATLGFDLDVKAWHVAWSDPVTEHAKDDWSACMAKSGYKIHDPLDDVPTSNDTAAPSKRVVREALTDIACKKSTNFISRANAENVKVAQQYLEHNQLGLQASKDFNDHALEKANKIIKKSS